MKRFLLTAIAFITASSLYAQFPADYKIEMGLSGGISPSTLPNGPDKLYQGTKSTVNFAAAFRIHYNINEHWQIGGEIGATRWQTSGTTPLTDNYGTALQPQKVTFVIANPAISVCAQANRMIPFYSKYKEFNKANIYYGISAGLISTINDGNISNSQYKQSPDPAYSYVSQYDYGFGIGYVAGVQVGFEYYIIKQLGVNVEFAGRYTYIGTNDTRYNHENSEYQLLYFPATVGVRLRF